MNSQGINSLLRVIVPLVLMGLAASAQSGAESSVNPELIAAVRLRDVPVVLRLLATCADVNGKDERGTAPLHWAAASGSREIAQALIECGANVNAGDDHGSTPLHAAASWGRAEVADLLLLHGANTGAADGKGDTPLHLAVTRLVTRESSAPKPTAEDVTHTIAIVKVLAEHGANLNAGNLANVTPLQIAVLSGQSAVVNALLERGASARGANPEGVGPLLIAARVYKADIGADLIAHGADPNARTQSGQTPLSWAAQHGDADFVAMLLAHGASVNAKGPMGKAPLFWAVQSELYFRATNADSSSPLAWFALAMREQVPELRSEVGWTELTRELQNSMQRWHDVATALFEHGAAVGRNEDSDIELYDAIYLGDPALVAALVEHGANVNTTRFEESTLQAAIGERRADIAQYLIDKGASVNAKNYNNRTPLHLVAKKMHDPKLVDALLAHGAKIDAVDEFGETPLAAAMRVGNGEVADALRQHGGSGGAKPMTTPTGNPARPLRTLQLPDCGDDFYPREALIAGISGSTVLRLCIGANDRIDRPTVLVRGSGNAALDQAAIRCMAAGHYEAATVNGLPVPSCKDYKVTFATHRR